MTAESILYIFKFPKVCILIVAFILKGKNEFTKLTPTMIENEMIPIPYNIYGEPYIEKQNDIANKYKIMVMIKKQIEERLNELLNSDLIF